MEHHFEVILKLAELRRTELLVRSLVGMFLPLFCVGDLETSIGLMPAAGELMMLSRLFIVPGAGSMVLQGSRIMSALGIL